MTTRQRWSLRPPDALQHERRDSCPPKTQTGQRDHLRTGRSPENRVIEERDVPHELQGQAHADRGIAVATASAGRGDGREVSPRSTPSRPAQTLAFGPVAHLRHHPRPRPDAGRPPTAPTPPACSATASRSTERVAAVSTRKLSSVVSGPAGGSALQCRRRFGRRRGPPSNGAADTWTAVNVGGADAAVPGWLGTDSPSDNVFLQSTAPGTYTVPASTRTTTRDGAYQSGPGRLPRPVFPVNVRDVNAAHRDDERRLRARALRGELGGHRPEDPRDDPTRRPHDARHPGRERQQRRRPRREHRSIAQHQRERGRSGQRERCADL